VHGLIEDAQVVPCGQEMPLLLDFEDGIDRRDYRGEAGDERSVTATCSQPRLRRAQASETLL
jgi:hypothetical protein